MNERLKTYASGAIGFAAVALIVGGSFAVASAVGSAPVESPRPATFVTLDDERESFDAPITVEDEQTAIAARKAAAEEAFRIEAERKAAEEAARIAAEEEAARQAAAEQAQRQAAQTYTEPATGGTSGGGQTAEPAPAPAPAPVVQCPGNASAIEVDGAGNHLSCMPNTAPNGGSCFEGDNGMLPECQPFRP